MGSNRRQLIRMSDEEVQSFLARRQTMNVATNHPNGSIHLVAMWYGFVGGEPAFATFAKSQKVANLRRDPRITVLVEGGDHYEQLIGVEIVGRGEIVEDEARLMECGRSVIQRYWNPGTDDETEQMAVAMVHKRVAVIVHPERVVSWDHSKLAGRY